MIKKLLKNNYFKYCIVMIVLFIMLFLMSFLYTDEKKTSNNKSYIEKTNIKEVKEDLFIDVEYPRFNETSKDKILTDYIYAYVKEFKSNKIQKKSLFIDYDIYEIGKYINIVFSINNSTNSVRYHNIIIDTSNNKKVNISSLYNKEYLKNEILDLVKIKYSIEIYNIVSKSNINNFTYLIDDNRILVYFYNIDFGNINYIPNISISLLSEKEVFKDENEYYDSSMYIGFTFDDGPSDYTLDVLRILDLYDSTATFFMLGNKMKYKEEIVKSVYKSNSEIASHTYSHKYLTKLSESDLNKEVNSTQVVFNEITGGNIEYVRPPYGSYNSFVLSKVPYPLITWNIDPKDWLYRDSDKVYDNVINNACNGCIVLMHDVYPETVEALKKIIPELKSRGYTIVSISNLLKYSNTTIEKGSVLKKVDIIDND